MSGPMYLLVIHTSIRYQMRLVQVFLHLYNLIHLTMKVMFATDMLFLPGLLQLLLQYHQLLLLQELKNQTFYITALRHQYFLQHIDHYW